MVAEDNDPTEPEPVRLTAQPLVAQAMISRATLTVIPADGVEVEPSTAPKYLRLITADYVCYTSVFLVVNGQRYEITVDTLPDEGETTVADSQ